MFLNKPQQQQQEVCLYHTNPPLQRISFFVYFKTTLSIFFLQLLLLFISIKSLYNPWHFSFLGSGSSNPLCPSSKHLTYSKYNRGNIFPLREYSRSVISLMLPIVLVRFFSFRRRKRPACLLIEWSIMIKLRAVKTKMLVVFGKEQYMIL